jgi:hypothetical protein
MENICKPCKPKILCQEINCQKRCSFNFKGKSAIYCKEHKKEGMIDVKHKTCDENNCNKRPHFNFKGEKQGIYCFEHKKKEMIDVSHKTCEESNCNKRPNFNFKGEKQRIYCFEHKKKEMVDVSHKTCKETNCQKRPHFNFKEEKYGIYCFNHKTEEMVDVNHKRCLTINCDIRGNKKYEGYCLFCFINTFPDKPISKNYKTKEMAVGDYIKEQFKDLTLIFDKQTQDSCSKRRPDILLDLGYQVIIIEIDENQHEDYQEICENKRTMEISQDLGHRPVVFIRFNPDAYNNITSCWAPNKLGILTIKKSKQKEWSERLEKLKETVNYWLNNQTQKTINVVYLFYDT